MIVIWSVYWKLLLCFEVSAPNWGGISCWNQCISVAILSALQWFREYNCCEVEICLIPQVSAFPPRNSEIIGQRRAQRASPLRRGVGRGPEVINAKKKKPTAWCRTSAWQAWQETKWCCGWTCWEKSLRHRLRTSGNRNSAGAIGVSLSGQDCEHNLLFAWMYYFL